MANKIKKFTIKGFKSIKEIIDFELKDLNILIGANGAGKSNLIQLFKMLKAMSQKSFAKFILDNGGADDFLFNGPKVTEKIFAKFYFTSYKGENNGYKFTLTPSVNENFIIEEYRKYGDYNWKYYGTPNSESKLYDEKDEKSRTGEWNGVGHFVYESISKWMIYHFHDTSSTAAMRRSEIVDDNKILRSNAANIAPFLLNLKNNDNFTYNEIIKAIQLVTPFFDDFILDIAIRGEKESVKLNWMQKGSDYPMQAYHLSDGTIRFICLATALLQPLPPPVIIFDEPELGLHPLAISILAELIISASKKTQVIVSTQSPALIDNFAVKDIIVVNRENGGSTLRRLQDKDFSSWLEDYSLGELWTKNVIVGGPVHE